MSFTLALLVLFASTTVSLSADPKAAFQQARFDGIDKAMSDEAPYHYVQEMTFEQLNTSGKVIALDSRIFRTRIESGERNRTELSRTSRGKFDFGVPFTDPPMSGSGGKKSGKKGRRGFGINFGKDKPIAVGDASDYSYRQTGPEGSASQRLVGVEAVVRPDRRRGHKLHRMKLLLDPGTLQVHVVDASHVIRSMLIDADIDLRAEASRAADGGFIPNQLGARVRYKLPFASWRHVRLRLDYREHIPASKP